jgi:ubiquinone/menaquinone biosynthesis C-methylase UbiE
MTSTQPADAADLKACCAKAYEHDLVARLLGPSYHPGGLALTRRLAEALDLGAARRVLDVATGPGTTAVELATRFGARVDGVDLGVANVERATAAAAAAGVADTVRFRHGDAELLPFDDRSFDAVVCECSLCLFSDKAAAIGEMARVLRPEGRLGISDVALDPERLPRSLRDLAARIACLADARPLEGYLRLLEDAGLQILAAEHHDQALADMIEQIDLRLATLGMLGPAALGDLDMAHARARCADASRAVDEGIAGYVLVVAQKPAA